MSARFVAIVSLGIMVFHQAGTALLMAGLARPREALLLAGVIFLLYPLWRVARSTGNAGQVLRLGPAPAASYPLSVLALGAAMPASLVVGEWIAESPAAMEELLTRVVLAHGAQQWIVALLAAAVVPALGEELLFRGFLQRGLEPRLGPAGAIVISSLAFGAVHGPGRAVPAALLGVLLGWIAWRTGSVRPVIAAHLFSNATIVVAANLRGDPRADLWEGPPPWPLVLGGLLVTAAAVAGIAAATRARDGGVAGEGSGGDGAGTDGMNADGTGGGGRSGVSGPRDPA